MSSKFRLFVAVLVLALAVSATAGATTLKLHLTGEFGPTTTLGGTALGENTAFSFDGVFDPALNIDLSLTPGLGIFHTEGALFTIAGHGTYTTAPGADIAAVFLSPPAFAAYVVAFGDSVADKGYPQAFSGTTSPFYASAPTPTIFTGFADFGAPPTFDITFTDNTILSIRDRGALVGTAEITGSAVPEPATWLLMTLGLGAVGLARRKRHQTA